MFVKWIQYPLPVLSSSVQSCLSMFCHSMKCLLIATTWEIGPTKLLRQKKVTNFFNLPEKTSAIPMPGGTLTVYTTLKPFFKNNLFPKTQITVKALFPRYTNFIVHAKREYLHIFIFIFNYIMTKWLLWDFRQHFGIKLEYCFN